MAKEFTPEDDALLAELGIEVEVEVKKKVSRTPREERIIAGFEEIQRFTQEHGHRPQHGEDRDIFERLSALRAMPGAGSSCPTNDGDRLRSLHRIMNHFVTAVFGDGKGAA